MKTNEKGFTLVEVIVGVIIGSLVFLVASRLINVTVTTSTMSQEVAVMNSNVELFMSELESEVRSTSQDIYVAMNSYKEGEGRVEVYSIANWEDNSVSFTVTLYPNGDLYINERKMVENIDDINLVADNDNHKFIYSIKSKKLYRDINQTITLR